MANKIIGRVNEQRELKDIFISSRSEFVAIYGRRRIGKTYLIHNFFVNRKCIYLHAQGSQTGDIREQLENFTNALSETFFNNEPIKVAESWKEAFERLTRAMENSSGNKKNKIVLFFDELPWMATPKSGLLDALDYYWNRTWSNMPNLKLIICGSSASWIIKKIIYSKGGLHNRVTKEINLNSFSLYETKEYLQNMGCEYNDEQILEIYMAIGGVPYYLNSIKKHLSAMQNINKLCFSGTDLFVEFDNLFSSLFKEPDSYIEIIRVIADTRYGISRPDIEKKCKLSKKGGSLSDKLKALQDAGFILSFKPLMNDTRELFYKVIDEYSLFYMQWIEPEKDSLLKMEKNSNFWKSKYKTPAWYAWAGYSFEAVSYKHLNIIRKVLNIPAGSRASTWKYIPKNSSENGAQIDLLFDREDKSYTICEIKYTEKQYVIDKDYSKQLRNKEDVFVSITKTKKQIFLTMVAANGVKENAYYDVLNGVVTSRDFFDPKYI